VCRVRLCASPEHLRAVTQRENVLAPGSLALAADCAARLTCPAGHPLDGVGAELVASDVSRGRRVCHPCHLARHTVCTALRAELASARRCRRDELPSTSLPFLVDALDALNVDAPRVLARDVSPDLLRVAAAGSGRTGQLARAALQLLDDTGRAA